MHTVLHTKTAIRRKAMGRAPLLIAAVLIAAMALILSGCNLFSPAEYIKAQMKGSTDSGGGAATYTVTFHAQGHGTAPAPQSVNHGAFATNPGDLSETGWTFGGWFKDASCDYRWNFADTVTGNLDLYAKWTDQNLEDFDPGVIPAVANISSDSGTTLYSHIDNIKSTPGNYVIDLSGSQPHNFTGIITLGNGVNISLRGTASDTVRNSGYNGALFIVGAGATLILRGPTLQGRASGAQAYPVVYVGDGVFFLRSGTITGNVSSYINMGGGVSVDGTGRFTMSGGIISDNEASGGGGVYADGSMGSFVKTGGTVTGTGSPNPNTATGTGTAVYVSSGPKYRNTTAGPGVNLNTATAANWNQ